MQTRPGLKDTWVIFLIPGTVVLVTLFGGFLPSWLHPLYLVGVAVVILITVTVRSRFKAHAHAGLKPKKSGYSAKLDLLHQKLRERADAIESAQRFHSRKIEYLPRAFDEFIEDVRRTALQVDQKDLVPELPKLIGKDSHILDLVEEDQEGLLNPEMTAEVRAEIESYTRDLRETAEEIGLYSANVRAKGGVYRLPGSQLAGCSLMLLGCFGYGAYVVWQYYQSPREWQLWAGIGMVLLAVGFTYVVYRMQTDPA